VNVWELWLSDGVDCAQHADSGAGDGSGVLVGDNVSVHLWYRVLLKGGELTNAAE